MKVPLIPGFKCILQNDSMIYEVWIWVVEQIHERNLQTPDVSYFTIVFFSL